MKNRDYHIMPYYIPFFGYAFNITEIRVSKDNISMFIAIYVHGKSAVISNSLWHHWLQPTRLLCHGGMEFSKEYSSGLPFTTPGYLLDPRIKPTPTASLLHWQADSLPLSYLENSFTAAILTVVKTWKKPKCLWKEEWTQKSLANTYNRTLFSLKKRKDT